MEPSYLLPTTCLFLSGQARGLKVTCLLCYCSEGDNIGDSYNLAEAACRVLGLRTSDRNGKLYCTTLL